MRVTVVDRDAMRRIWNMPGLFRVILRTVTIADTCPVCGGKRGEPVKRLFHEDGESYCADTWVNPCGHIDLYQNVLREAEVLEVGHGNVLE